MKSLLPDFEVCAAGQRHFHAHEYFVVGQGGNVDALDFQIFSAVQHGRCHVSIAFAFYSHS